MEMTIVVLPHSNTEAEVKWTLAGAGEYRTGTFRMPTAGTRSAIGRPMKELTFEVAISHDSNGASPASFDEAARVFLGVAQTLVTDVLSTTELHSMPDLPPVGLPQHSDSSGLPAES